MPLTLAAPYAVQADFEAYVENWTTTDAAALDRLLRRASDDIDLILGSYPVVAGGTWDGRKIDPTTLDAGLSRALVRATCAQAEYRDEMGEEFFTRAQYEAVSGPEFSTSGKQPIIGPKVMRELAGTGLLRNVTSLANRRGVTPPWLDFSYNVGDEADGDFGGLRRY